MTVTEKQVRQALRGLGLTEREWEVLTREGAPDDSIIPRPFLMEFAQRIAAISEGRAECRCEGDTERLDWIIQHGIFFTREGLDSAMKEAAAVAPASDSPRQVAHSSQAQGQLSVKEQK